MDLESADKNSFSKDSNNDRFEAINLIQSIEKRLPLDQKYKALLQKAQLFQLLGQEKRAEEILTRVKKEAPANSDESLSATEFLADYYFSLSQFSFSRQLYAEIQASRKNNDFSEYRLAWCDLNLGSESTAVTRLETVLSKKSIDPSLKKEAARDIVIFYSRQPYNPDNIEKIKLFSEKNDLQENLGLYKDELKRLGKRKEAAIVLTEFLKYSKTKEMTLTAKADLFESFASLGQKAKANAILAEIVIVKCGDQCPDIHLRIHRSLRYWANLEIPNPSPELINSFILYSKLKPVDQSAMLFGTKVFQDSKNYAPAVTLMSVIIANTKDPKILENALQAQVDSAVKSKDSKLREIAFKNYLDKGSDRSLKTQIQLDLIQALLDNKNYPEAEKYALAAYSQNPDNQIGEMLLLVYKNSNQSRKEKELNFRMSKGDVKSEYFRNYKRISLAEIKNRIDTSKATESDMVMLIDLSDKNSSNSEKFRILNDAFLIAMKNEKFPELKKISVQLAQLAPSLGSADRKLAYEKRILVADLELDFATSLYFERQIESPDSSNKLFRIAMKARLSDSPNLKLEADIMKSKDFTNLQKIWILENQLNNSSDPLRLLEINLHLIKNNSTHSKFVLMAMSKNSQAEVERYVKRHPQLNSTFIGLLLTRRDKLENLNLAFNKALKIDINSNSVVAFGNSLETKISLIRKVDKLAARETADPIVKMISLSYLKYLNQSLISDLNQSKQKLNVGAKNQAVFNAKLDSEIAKLALKISKTDEQIVAIWKKEQILSEFEQVVSDSYGPQKQALMKEINYWHTASVGKSKDLIEDLTSIKSSNSKSLDSYYSSLKRNPFDISLAQKLAKEEESRGNYLISTFLVERTRKLGGI
jgi:hypothetical protein